MILINGLAEQGESWYRNRDDWQQHFDVQMPGILVYDGPVLQERMQQPRADQRRLSDRSADGIPRQVRADAALSPRGQQPRRADRRRILRPPSRKVGRMVLLCPSGMGGEERLPITEGARHKNYQGLVESVFYDRRLAGPGVVQYYERKFASRSWRQGDVPDRPRHQEPFGPRQACRRSSGRRW